LPPFTPNLREAIKQAGKVAVGKVVFTSRERVIGLEPRGKGLLGNHFAGFAPIRRDQARTAASPLPCQPI
jgi:non-homologous end joining protein Ku